MGESDRTRLIAMDEYIIWRPENGQTKEDGRKIKALCVEYAVQDWAQREDCEGADYLIVSGQDARVMVCNGHEEREYIVSGESVPQYRARIAT